MVLMQSSWAQAQEMEVSKEREENPTEESQSPAHTDKAVAATGPEGLHCRSWELHHRHPLPAPALALTTQPMLSTTCQGSTITTGTACRGRGNSTTTKGSPWLCPCPASRGSIPMDGAVKWAQPHPCCSLGSRLSPSLSSVSWSSAGLSRTGLHCREGLQGWGGLRWLLCCRLRSCSSAEAVNGEQGQSYSSL